MGLLHRAKNQTAFMKIGLMGFAGSGKSFTAKELAIGLANASGKKSVAFFDTEHGSDFLIPDFEEAGIELLVAKTRAFRDLIAFMKEAEETCGVAIIDSISHVWTELMDAYQKRFNRSKGLEFQDWAKVKGEWRQFTDLYLNSRMHVILCGRAGYEYDYETSDGGKRELIKTGTKMKAETEMGYEPSLLVEMWRVKKSEIAKDPDVHGWIHRAVVLKDRTDTMNGQEIDNPTYESFMPIFSRLSIGGEHVVIDTTRNSESMFESPESNIERRRLVEITLEQVEEALTLAGLDSRSSAGKKAMAESLIHAFGTSAWTAIKSKHLEDLQSGLERLRVRLGLKEGAGSPEEVELLLAAVTDFVSDCVAKGADATEKQRERIADIAGRVSASGSFLHAGLVALAGNAELGKGQAGALVGKLKELQKAMGIEQPEPATATA